MLRRKDTFYGKIGYLTIESVELIGDQEADIEVKAHASAAVEFVLETTILQNAILVECKGECRSYTC